MENNVLYSRLKRRRVVSVVIIWLVILAGVAFMIWGDRNKYPYWGSIWSLCMSASWIYATINAKKEFDTVLHYNCSNEYAEYLYPKVRHLHRQAEETLKLITLQHVKRNRFAAILLLVIGVASYFIF